MTVWTPELADPTAGALPIGETGEQTLASVVTETLNGCWTS